MQRSATFALLATLFVGMTLAGCDHDEADRERCGEGASCSTLPAEPGTAPLAEAASASTFVACEPVPRFDLGGIEYENQRFDDLVAEADLGPVVGRIESVPPEVERCEVVELDDGDGTWPVGTEIHEISGVDPTKALAAGLGNGVYLRFDATP